MSNPDETSNEAYTYGEKLKAIAEGLMDPKEIGLATAEEAQTKLAPEPVKKPVFGTTLIFRAGVVPLELRAEWAYQETKIVMAPADAAQWKADWIKEHTNEFPIQGDLCCGNANARFGQTYKDPILGLCQMLRIAADTLEAKYTEEPTQEQPAEVLSETTTGPKAQADTANEPSIDTIP